MMSPTSADELSP